MLIEYHNIIGKIDKYLSGIYFEWVNDLQFDITTDDNPNVNNVLQCNLQNVL